MSGRRVLVGALLAVGAVVGLAAPAAAHPLGNFTVNRYARIELASGTVRIHYVLDQAEIPAFQSRRALAAGRDAFAEQLVDEIAAGLRLTVDGRALPVRPVGHLLSEPPGQGGLPTLRLSVNYEAALPAAAGPEKARQGSFVDGNQPQRVGWREVLVVPMADSRVLTADVPGQDVSDELRRYPEDLLSAPLDRRAATFSFVPGRRAVGPSPLTGAARSPDRSGAGAGSGPGFAALVTRDPSGVAALAGLLALALGFGALHALGPGHGKTLMAAYLVGTKGRPRDAVALGAIVSAMHTVSVLALALVLVQLDRSVGADRIYPWLELVSGTLVIALGAWLVARRGRDRRARRAAAAHHEHEHGDHGAGDHEHGDHEHGHPHEHGHDHGPGGHTHALAPDVAPLSRRGLVALGTAGGLFPSPTAVVVVVSAFSLQRAGLGLALVAAFSIGLATTLTAVGLALVKGRTVLERRGAHRAVELLPLAGAVTLVIAGAVIAVRGVTALG